MPPGIYPRKCHSDETKRKIAAGNTGKIFSPERKAAISNANTMHIDPAIVENIKVLLDERVCNLDAVLKELHLKNGRVIRREMSNMNIMVCNELKFFNCSISYLVGKQLLAYLRLGIHPKEICERLGIKEKTFCGSAKKLQSAHGFKYTWERKKFRGDLQTKPEKQTCDILDSLGVIYTTEFSFGNFYYDIHILGTQLLIEVQGDYWHANPEIYIDKTCLNKTQKSNVRRDHFKRRFAHDGGFYVLYIWENDLKTKQHDTKIIIDTYTKRAYAKASNFNIL